MAGRVCLTMKELKKIKVIEQVADKKITGRDAAIVLGYTEVHVSRLKKKYFEEGIQGLIRTSRASPKRIPDEVREKIADIYEKKYHDFNVLHFNDKLEEEHDIMYSYETIRQILIEKGLHSVKKRKKGHKKKRPRMTNEGMLIQMDSSQHNWIESIPEKHWFISTVDDATGKILYAKFFDEDNMFNNMEVIRKVVEDNGIFLALYTDKASHFKTIRLGGLHNDVNIEQDDTNIEKALNDLNITLITANSAEAKGRIERSYRTLQDRLIKEMRIRNIKDYESANKYLPSFINYFNRKWNKNPSAKKVYEKVPDDIDLNVVFTKRVSRKIRNDYTISYNCHIIQLPPMKKDLRRCIVNLYITKSNEIYILYKNEVIFETDLNKKPDNSKREAKIKEILKNRSFNYVP